ncbi:hypothetical protein [Paraburkholderia caffeinilytica]|uniref:hypothetical protein n=1 Tax=Paraburkholderia caffeinilytica TaxID=1761016 RepID=UPI0013BEA5B0|nr:hypothetical protein [Paraburkholderia caffeinilytica]
MSEYPCTGIDKAILKFGLQDSKISQNVSVKVSVFFLNFVRQLLPNRRLAISFSAFLEAESGKSCRFPTKLTPRLSPSFCRMPADKKMTLDFFRLIFLFKKSFGHFFFTERIILLDDLYSFHLTRFY